MEELNCLHKKMAALKSWLMKTPLIMFTELLELALTCLNACGVRLLADKHLFGYDVVF